MAKSVVRRGCGEIGKHARFRAWWAQALEGSSPFSRTTPSSAHLDIPVIDVGVSLLRLDRRVQPDAMDLLADRHDVARAVEEDRGDLLGKVLLEGGVGLGAGCQVECVPTILEVPVDEHVLLHAGKVEAAGVRLG